ncbi:hypothetical protein FRB96_007352 [Tulasnella sp. 330]|nr:hypothetical protein FRB96_007352 [Tulasnella sp. 330]
MNSPLHVHYYYKNQRGFKQVLDAARSSTSSAGGGTGGMGSGSSGPRSWRDSYYGQLQEKHTNNAADVVNARDPMGRTVLHLICSSTDPGSLPYLQMLLAHPLINVNAQDVESHWTPLHRCLWYGNLHAAVMLAGRTDVNLRLKDRDGYTPFDLYNESVDGTTPTVSFGAGKELFVWGSNRNGSLGLGDDGERLHPEQVKLYHTSSETDSRTSSAKLDLITFEGIAMARLHTIAITSESTGNVRACGSGNYGRLGPGTLHHTQQRLVPLPHAADLSIVSVSLGQDHTLAVTSEGEVYSWGFNRFHQLGYAVEAYVKDGKVVGDESIQPTARRVLGMLKFEKVKGVAACKVASACWTEHDVFTWGTNRGQLGYSKTAQPIQVTPRKVTPITLPVLSVAMTDFALCILLSSKEVPWFRPSKALVGRSRTMERIACSEDTFTSVSSSGDVFTWIVGGDTVSGSSSGNSANGAVNYSNLVKPQRIWTSNKYFNNVKDVALGPDGTAILCTQSGHVYVRNREAKFTNTQPGTGASTHTALNKPFKFHRVPFLNRVVHVAASPVGAFAAMRMDATPPEIVPNGPSLEQELSQLLPFLHVSNPYLSKDQLDWGEVHDDDGDDARYRAAAVNDVAVLQEICKFISTSTLIPPDPAVPSKPYAYPALDQSRAGIAGSSPGADILATAMSVTIALHSSILSARSNVLRGVLATRSLIHSGVLKVCFMHRRDNQGDIYESRGCLAFSGCHPLSLLLLIQYIYSDDIAAVWDRQIGAATENSWRGLDPKVKPAEVLAEIRQLAEMLELRMLLKSLEGMYRVQPAPSLVTDMSRMFSAVQEPGSSTGLGGHDVVMELADCSVPCHSTVLRARSPFFSALFDDPTWTRDRWTDAGTIVVTMRHLEWKYMVYVFQYIYCGTENDIFDKMGSFNQVDDLLDYVFSVMAAANELLLDRVVLMCSRIAFRHVTITNACSLLRDATVLHATRLVEALQHYMVMNLELFVESGHLEELQPEVLKDLSAYTRTHQMKKYPVTRSNSLVTGALNRWAEWLAIQDVALLYYTRKSVIKPSPRLPPRDTSPANPRRVPSTVPLSVSPAQGSPLPSGPSSLVPENDAARVVARPPSASPATLWKGKGFARSLEISDLRAIMASEREKVPATPPPRVIGFDVPNSSPNPSDALRWTPKASYIQRQKSLQNLESVSAMISADKGSPWRVLPKATTSIAAIDAEAILERSLGSHRPSSSRHPPSGVAKYLDAYQLTALKLSPTLSSSLQLPISGLGPVITPVRSTSTGHVPVTKKKTERGEAWTRTPSVPPVREPRGTVTSLLDIPRQEQEYREPKKVKKTFREIQEEEEEQRVQQDFERWWSMEEARVREEKSMLGEAKAISISAGHALEARGGRGGRGRPRAKKRLSAGRVPTGPAVSSHQPDTFSDSLGHTPAVPIGRPSSSQQARGGRPRRK